MIPKIGIDFRKGSYAKLKCYSVLCASNRTRGAVVQVAQRHTLRPDTRAGITTWIKELKAGRMNPFRRDAL
ncbi:hypothetical protein CIT31_31395 [Mesorhizobium wenxiniae]|uniref:Uncharacterized protein n=1 Tax=Mesorhizobium wenxiniae TaxID=2014805 RepID=A0A271K9M8_9HYPH|nr:hypothetical protein CIT31_31395 [Mesorhizobium wenxiniae]